MNFEIWTIPFVLVSSFFNSYGSYLLKRYSKRSSLNVFSAIFNLRFVIAISTLFFGAFLFVLALKGGPLSIMYPLSSTSYLWTIFFATKYLNESMNLYKWLGIISIMVGIGFIVS